MLCNSVSEGRRNALQDYQKTEGMRLLVGSPDSSHLTKSKKVSMAKCARACSRNRRLPFTCRYVCFALASGKLTFLSFDWLFPQRVVVPQVPFIVLPGGILHCCLSGFAGSKLFCIFVCIALWCLLHKEAKENWPLCTSLSLLSFPSYSPERSSMIIKTGNANGCHSTGTHQESRVNRTSTTNFIKRKVPSTVSPFPSTSWYNLVTPAVTTFFPKDKKVSTCSLLTLL